MRYIVYPTAQCSEDARHLGLLDEIERLKSKVERDQSIANWDTFLPSPFVKKSMGNSHRLVAAVRPLNEYLIICLLRTFVRSDDRYRHFLLDPTSSDLAYPADNELTVFLNRLKHLPPKAQPPTPLEHEYLHLTSDDYLDESEGVVYESWHWTELAGRAQFRELAIRYYDLIVEDIISAPVDKRAGTTEWYTNEVGILCRYYPDQKRLFLIAPLLDSSDSHKASLKLKYQDFLDLSRRDIPEEELLRRSGRSYPTMVFYADGKVWRDIENNSEGNLALSPEEFKIMQTVLRPTSEDSAFPLFINGGPGSGKSTILQYLFAEYLYCYLTKTPKYRLPFPPLYLTYSGKLLEAARRSVEIIFRCNSKKSLHKIDLDSEESRAALDSSFKELHKLLLQEFLPSNIRQAFPIERRVDFRTFHSLYDKEMKKRPDAKLRKLSAELAWHVIRTYIKGMREDSETEFDSDAYAELPAKQRSVDSETFDTVYSHVWKWYRRLSAKDNLWDDQDLARCALDSNVELSRYPAVFCDEAQDFTKIELELIQQLSLYSKRAVSPQELHKIPFGFAGDPFQTLNPTGFNWASVQAGFHEKIVQSLDPLGRSQLKFNYRPLGFNYRSTQNIVGFCNVIQLLRGILFDRRDLKCQKSWLSEDSAMPVFFDVQDGNCQKNLRAETEIIIILPCQEGEENDYVAEDNSLMQISKGSSRNFFSPMRAKGLEFSRVVLYKFGDECLRRYPELLTPLATGIPHTERPEAALPLEYFMNRLYVASSRAKKRLIVIDTDRAIREFWGHECFQNLPKLLEQYPESSRSRYGWSIDDLSFIQQGRDESWSEDRDDPMQLAELFLADGKAQRDSYKLEKAEAIFQRLGMEPEAQECRALKYEFNASYIKAGDEYLSLHKTKDALRCFWKGAAYSRICEVEQFHDHVERRLSEFMVGDRNSSSCSDLLEYLAGALNGVQREKILADDNVGRICDQSIASLAKAVSETATSFWSHAFACVRSLRESGIQFRTTLDIGELAFRAEEYEGAIEVWNELSPDMRPTRYQDAQAELLIGKWESFRRNEGIPAVDPGSVADAYTKRKRFREALDILYKYPDEAALDRVRGLIGDDREAQVTAAAALLKARCRVQRWSEGLDIVSGKRTGGEAPLLRNTFILELARSEHLLTETSPSEIDRIRDYLKRSVLDAMWDSSMKVAVVGAAIEKADRILDSLAFYEMVWRNGRIQGSAEDIAFARARWVKCKDRQALRSDERNQKESATKYTKEAEEFARRWGISLLDIPEYPPVSSTEDLMIITKHFTETDTNAMTDERTQAIGTLLQTGMSVEKIAVAFGLSPAQVRGILKK
jgi:tetratricopeptide (TPR) repeat protein